jgi:acyl carrier protein
MTTHSSTSLEERVMKWLQDVKPKATEAEIRSSDLIETRILDSMQFLDFVFFLNELCEIDVTQRVTVKDMRTLQRIVAFVQEQRSVKLAS